MMDKQLAAVCRQDLSSFAERSFRELNPGTSYVPNFHQHAITAALERMRTGSLRRLIINVPPRLMKSTIVSCALPAFLLGHDPTERVIVTTYSDQLSEKLSSDTQRLMTAPFYRTLFPATHLSRQTKGYLETDRGGSSLATSVGGSITGLGGDWIVMDDPHNASDAYSAPMRDAVKRYFNSSLLSRLNNPSKGRIILVMQRLHEDDLTGHLMEQGGWELLKLEATATEDAQIDIGQGKFHRIVVGDLLDPVRLPQSVLDERKRAMGSRDFSAQYQQQPVPAEGNIVKRAWIQRYQKLPPLTDGEVVQSWDTAVKTDPQHDYSVCTTWLRVEQLHYLAGVWRGKVDYPGLRAKVCELQKMFEAERVLIEDAGSGAALIQELRNSPAPAIGRRSKDTKESRLSVASALIERGQVLLPNDAPWLADFESELLGFPGVKHDDQVDSFSQYAAWVRENEGAWKLEWDWGYDYPVNHDTIANHVRNLSRGY
jgi:predicted phage terminase large subunit-like protein